DAEVVEFAIEDDAVVDAGPVRRALQDQELGCSVIGLFGPSRDLSSENSEVRRIGRDYARRCLDIAGETGATLYSGAVVGVGGDGHRGAPGDGHIQWHEVGDALRAIQYERYVVFESFNPNGRLAPLARIWRPLAASQDVLAKNGVAFLDRELRDQANRRP